MHEKDIGSNYSICTVRFNIDELDLGIQRFPPNITFRGSNPEGLNSRRESVH